MFYFQGIDLEDMREMMPEDDYAAVKMASFEVKRFEIIQRCKWLGIPVTMSDLDIRDLNIFSTIKTKIDEMVKTEQAAKSKSRKK